MVEKMGYEHQREQAQRDKDSRLRNTFYGNTAKAFYSNESSIKPSWPMSTKH